MEELIRLLEEDTISNYHGMEPNKSDFINKLLEFLPQDVLSDYVRRYDANNLYDPIWMLQPVDLLIAGKQLVQISKTQNNRVIDQLKKKFKDLSNSSTGLADLLSELEVATCVGFYYQIELNKPAGTGKKDSDLYVPNPDLYVEVKNYAIGRSGIEKKIGQQFDKLSAEGKTGNYGVNNNGTLIKLADSDYMLSVDVSGYDPSKQIIGYLNSANTKFSQDSTVILFITNLSEIHVSTFHIVSLDWYKSNPLTPIKTIVVSTPRNSVNNIKNTYRQEFSKDETVNDFMRTVELI
jgi:hypothetical protein